MKIAIVGWGVEGKSAFRHYGPEHSYLIVNETPLPDFPEAGDKIKIQHLSGDRPTGITGQVQDLSYLNGIEDCDKIVFSVTAAKNLEAVFPPDDKFWHKAYTVQHIFFEEVKTRNIIGVTGTKGKGTTSTLITKMLEAAGKKTHLAGNIGLSVLDILPNIESNDWVVLELSNFQLYSLDVSPHIGVCLMMVEEHLDWHPDKEDYFNAKANLFRFQQPDDIAIYYAHNDITERTASFSPGIKIPFYDKPGARIRDDGMIVIGDDETEIMNRRDVKLLGEHNLQNICAAITTLWQVKPDVNAAKQIASTFSGLEHRLEFVREYKEAQYYDDSFGTTPDTAIVAMRSFIQPKIMIMGGSDKGASFESMTDEIIKQRVKHVILIGNTAPKIAQLLESKGFKNYTLSLTTMPEIVIKAAEMAEPGDVVLLSTGCASFGLFKDYKDRGNQFKEAVRSLS